MHTLKGGEDKFGEMPVIVSSLSKIKDGEKVRYAIFKKTKLGLHSLTPSPNGMCETSTTIFEPEETWTNLSGSDYDKYYISTKIIRLIVGGR